MTAYGTVETAVAAMKEGAYDFITKPVKRHAIVKSVRQALEKASLVAENRALKARLAELAPGVGGLVGDAPPFRAVLETLRQAAPTSATVLLVGESGTGKELAARLVHDLSPRAAGPVRADQLRGDPGGAARVRAVRPREGRVHRRVGAQGGPVRARPRRHAVPRRGRRDAARRPGEAAALPAGRRARARRRDRADPRGRARRRRDQQGPRRRGEGGRASARTSSTGSTSSRCGCRRCAIGARTCSPSRASSCGGWRTGCRSA